MDPEQLDSASARTYSTGQNTLDSELPTLPRRSEDEIGPSPGKDGRTLSTKVKIKLRLSSHDEEKIDIKVKEGEVAAILVDMKEDIEQEAANTEYENRPSIVGRFKEELGLEDEKSLLDVKRKCVEAPHSANARSNKQLVAAPAEMNDVLHLRGRVAPRSIASPLSPYCQVMANPSWETSEGYHRARGAMLHLHINEQETFYQVHRSLILTKIPRLPLIYFDLDDEEEDEHTLDESLHNVNLMIYWLYHEKLPLMVKIKRAGVFDGMTWDPIEFYMFAQKLYAFELMDCIREVLPLPGQSRAFV